MSYRSFVNAAGENFEVVRITETDECTRYSARILPTGELPIAYALPDDYERELAELIEARGWTETALAD